jgi:hypothetical protein
LGESAALDLGVAEEQDGLGVFVEDVLEDAGLEVVGADRARVTGAGAIAVAAQRRRC